MILENQAIRFVERCNGTLSEDNGKNVARLGGTAEVRCRIEPCALALEIAVAVAKQDHLIERIERNVGRRLGPVRIRY